MGVRLTAKDREVIGKLLAVAPESYSAADVRADLAGLAARLSRFDVVAARRGLEQSVADGNYHYSPTGLTDLTLRQLERTAADIQQLSMYERLVNDDPTALVRGVFTASRLNYLVDVTSDPSRAGGWDCLHVWNLVDALAVPDEAMVEAYLRGLPGPAQRGHPFTVLYANAVVGLLAGDASRMAGLEPDLACVVDRATFSQTDRAIMAVLLGITRRDTELVGEALTQVLAGHRRMEEDRRPGLLTFVSVPAHGLYRLAERALGPGAVATPAHRNWDEDFHRAADSAPPDLLDVVVDVLPLVERWLRDLPSRVDGSELLRAILHQRLAAGVRHRVARFWQGEGAGCEPV